MIVASTEGGVEIETVAAKSPEKIMREPIDPLAGLQPFQTRKLAKQLEFESSQLKAAAKLFDGLYRTFIGLDCSMVEVNPLVVTPKGEVLALDAKFNFDDNALYRHPEVAALRDTAEEDPREVEASKARTQLHRPRWQYRLSRQRRRPRHGDDGHHQILRRQSRRTSSMSVAARREEQVTEAFKILISDKNVKAILVNIFGGIMKCDVIAQGIINAAKTVTARCRWSFGWKERMSKQGKKLARKKAESP